MIIAFIIWTIVSAIFLIIAITTWNSKKEVGFFTGVEATPKKDPIAYNHAVAKIWFVYAGLLEASGIPMLFSEQNSPIFMGIVAFVMFLTIGIGIAYIRVDIKYRDK